MPADNVGWLTLLVSAARPKCCSRASAITKSSLSIMTSHQAPGPALSRLSSVVELCESDQDQVSITTRSIGDKDRPIWNPDNGCLPLEVKVCDDKLRHPTKPDRHSYS